MAGQASTISGEAELGQEDTEEKVQSDDANEFESEEDEGAGSEPSLSGLLLYHADTATSLLLVL